MSDIVNVPASEFRREIADNVNRVAYGGERILLTRHGRPLLAVVSIEDLELLEAYEASIESKP